MSNKNEFKILYQANYKNLSIHLNNSFSKDYILKKIKNNYPDKFDDFKYNKKKFEVKKFDNIKYKKKICFIKIDVEGLDHLVLYGMKKCIRKFLPVILVENNISNFKKIYDFLKKKYSCFFYNFEKNKLNKLSSSQIKGLQSGLILEKAFNKNSVNIFFIKK